MDNIKVHKRSIDINSTILSAIKKMDEIGKKLLIVFDNNKFVSLLSIGDIQRAVIRNTSLDKPIKFILREEFRHCKIAQSETEIKTVMMQYNTECMPILDEKGSLCDVWFWEDLFQTVKPLPLEQFNLPVVIMAGGQGKRLKPLTNILPKPLIPIRDKTIIENILDSFITCGSNNFHITINYKAEMIKYYFSQLVNSNYNIDFFHEVKPLGTAGSLRLLKNKINSTFFVTNCDILIDEDYSEVLRYHRENNNELTVVAALKHYPIPYGILESRDNGLLQSIIEKPELTFKINTGVYILEPQLIDEIPKNKFYHITFLIEKLQKEGRNVGVFPISEKSWIDMGDLSEYIKMIR